MTEQSDVKAITLSPAEVVLRHEMDVLRSAFETYKSEMQEHLTGLSGRITQLEGSWAERSSKAQTFNDFDLVLKAKFLELDVEDVEEWDFWAFVYYFRWLRRQTPTKFTITSWAQHQKSIKLTKKLVEELGGKQETLDYIEYAVFGTGHPSDLSYWQICSSGWINTLSTQVKPWKEANEVAKRMAETGESEVSG